MNPHPHDSGTMKSPHQTQGSLRLLSAALALVALAAGPLARAQQSFSSPDEALKALTAATRASDHAALETIFGPGLKDLLSGDPRQDAIELASFSKSLRQYAVWVHKADDRFVLDIGDQNWPMPIPLVRRAGAWQFDTEAGKEEVLNRRIGEDEINAIGVCRVYVQAQREYAAEDRDGTGMFKYAQHLKSSPGARDGLYWPAGPGEDPSPFGPLVADAHAEGYGGKTPEGSPQPYKGYRFRILSAQGPSAPGGAYSYIINGNMVAGFALVAFPAHWGESGVMTFIVNQWGRVYECNLGAQSAEVAGAMASFDPDAGWTPVPEP